MGIPSYTKQLLRKASKISSMSPGTVDYLFLDFNGMIHPSSHKVIQEIKDGNSNFTQQQVFDKIILQCISDLNYIVNKIKPTKFVYIAVDGVAPFAKMHQQRLRRFKVPLSDKVIFDSCNITPGTVFMNQLKQALIANKLPNAIFNFADSPGEGEHKIMKYIRNGNFIGNKVIFGLDADLIMLTIALNLENLWIYREEQDDFLIKRFGNYNFISIDLVRKWLSRDLNTEGVKSQNEINNKLTDYVLLCFFGGNDFLPNLPSIRINCGGLDNLMSIYGEFNLFLTKNGKINIPDFTKFIEILYERETSMVKRNINTLKQRNPDLKDPVGYTEDDWVRRHYTYHFKFNNLIKTPREFTPSHQEQDIIKITIEYIKTLEWILGYYLGTCNDYRHYYDYHATPTLYSILNQLKGGYDNFNFSTRDFCTEHQQLMCVLPKGSAELLPQKYRYLMTSPDSPLVMYYPESISFDTSFCSEEWQYKSVFLPVDFEEIIEVVKFKINK